MQESWSGTNRLAYPPSHARHIVAFARNSFEGCTGSAWTFTHGDNSGHLYTRQWECTKRRCELARRAIVPKCSQVGELRKYRENGKSVSSVSQWSGRPDLNRGPPAPKAGIPLKTTLLFSMLPLKQNNLVVIFACGWLCAPVPICLLGGHKSWHTRNGTLTQDSYTGLGGILVA